MARTRAASSLLITSLLLDASTSYPKTGKPPPHFPLRRAAAILSRVRSAISSRSNWAKDNSTFKTSRPIEVPLCARLDRSMVSRTTEQHLQRLRELNADRPRVADKMPDNYLYPGLLAVLLPRAKFIRCRRD